MRRVLAIVVLLAAAQSAAEADTPAAAACGFAKCAHNALEERLLADAADGRLDEFSPLGAALVAGGVENADSLRCYEQKAAALVEELRRSVRLVGASRRRVETVFEFMHRRILRGGYDLACTDLRRAFDEGRFNCISATVLFNYFAGELGLECRGLQMPGHAMSRVLLPRGAIDVETTCPHWLHPADDPLRQKAREVSPVELTAMIYYNRGVNLLAEKRFAEAAAANAKALRLDPKNAAARGNLLATINNWAIDLGDSHRFAEAAELLRQGLAMDAKFEAFARNYLHVHRQWIKHLCRAGRFEEVPAIMWPASEKQSR